MPNLEPHLTLSEGCSRPSDPLRDVQAPLLVSSGQLEEVSIVFVPCPAKWPCDQSHLAKCRQWPEPLSWMRAMLHNNSSNVPSNIARATATGPCTPIWPRSPSQGQYDDRKGVALGRLCSPRFQVNVHLLYGLDSRLVVSIHVLDLWTTTMPLGWSSQILFLLFSWHLFSCPTLYYFLGGVLDRLTSFHLLTLSSLLFSARLAGGRGSLPPFQPNIIPFWLNNACYSCLSFMMQYYWYCTACITLRL